MLPWWWSPLLGALIGWGTNAVAVALLFRPRRPVRLLRWTLQGVLPARRQELAEAAARALAGSVAVSEAVRARLRAPEVRRALSEAAADALAAAVRRRLPGFVPPALREALADYAASAAREEADRLLPEQLERVMAVLLDQEAVAAVVREQLDRLDLDRLEGLLRQVAARELRHVVRSGAVLGFLVGLLQALAAAFR